jgi:hypothetical protein
MTGLYSDNIIYKNKIMEYARTSHNVPAVYDVLTARIRALRSKDQDWQNVPE